MKKRVSPDSELPRKKKLKFDLWQIAASPPHTAEEEQPWYATWVRQVAILELRADKSLVATMLLAIKRRAKDSLAHALFDRHCRTLLLRSLLEERAKDLATTLSLSPYRSRNTTLLKVTKAVDLTPHARVRISPWLRCINGRTSRLLHFLRTMWPQPLDSASGTGFRVRHAARILLDKHMYSNSETNTFDYLHLEALLEYMGSDLHWSPCGFVPHKHEPHRVAAMLILVKDVSHNAMIAMMKLCCRSWGLRQGVLATHAWNYAPRSDFQSEYPKITEKETLGQLVIRFLRQKFSTSDERRKFRFSCALPIAHSTDPNDEDCSNADYHSVMRFFAPVWEA